MGSGWSEKELRRWLAARWPREAAPLTWVEPRSGGTFGAPDVFLPIEGRLVGVELKVGRAEAKGDRWRVRIKVRPAQKLWHSSMARKGIESWFLVAAGSGDRVSIVLVDPELAIKDDFHMDVVGGESIIVADLYQRVKYALEYKHLNRAKKGGFLLSTNKA